MKPLSVPIAGDPELESVHVVISAVAGLRPVASVAHSLIIGLMASSRPFDSSASYSLRRSWFSSGYYLPAHSGSSYFPPFHSSSSFGGASEFGLVPLLSSV